VVRNRLGNVRLYPCAIWDRPGALAYLPEGSNGTVADLEPASDLPPGARLIPTATLDDLLAGLDRVDMIKLDVEGAEFRVLRGAARTLQRRPLVVSELSPELLRRVSGASAEHYLTGFLDLGYGLSVIDRDGGGELLDCGRDLGKVLDALGATGSL